MNEMRLSTSFMNGVTSLFVPNLCPDHNNKVTGAIAPPTKMITNGNKINRFSLCPWISPRP